MDASKDDSELERSLGTRLPSEYDCEFGNRVRLLRTLKQRKSRAMKKRMTRAATEDRLFDFWFEETQTDRHIKLFDVEKGKVRITRVVAECIAKALDATPFERALLLEVAGYNGLAEFLAHELHADLDALAVAIGDVLSGKKTVGEMQFVMQLVIKAMIQQYLLEHAAGADASGDANDDQDSDEDLSTGENPGEASDDNFPTDSPRVPA